MLSMNDAGAMDAAERERSLANLKLERDAIALYDRLAVIEKDPHRATAFRTIAANERRHAGIWSERLRQAGAEIPPVGRPRIRVRFVMGVARVFGTDAVSDLVKAMEGNEQFTYESQGDPDVAWIIADEKEHAEIWQRLDAGLPGISAGTTNGSTIGALDTAAPATVATPTATTAATPATAPEQFRAADAAPGTRPARNESWHRSGRTGTLRAAIFGATDGLVSNLALVMGVAGATGVAAVDNHFIVLAGVAGILAGASSMAAGEYISMQSQRELFERQIDLEREEMRVMPEQEERELASIYRAKGLSHHEAAMVANRLMEDPQAALDTKVREELGLDPHELGSAWGAAGSSFVTFGIGALVPVVPFLIGTGTAALATAIVVALAALFLVGAGVSLLTGRGLVFGGLRQVAIGGVAAALTFVVGTLIGVTVG